MLIELVGVHKTYNRGEPNEVQALRDISLTVDEGEMVCLKGPSGSGKTTALSIIGCIFPPTSGQASIGGKKISRLPDHFLCRYRMEMIGFIFQNFNLFPELTVLENITLPLYPAGLSPARRKQLAEPLLQQMRLSHRSKFPAGKISGGEMQRTAICRALIHNPPVVLADEPTAHLDASLAEEFMQEMGRLKAEGKTLVLTSHDPQVYRHKHIDRVLCMADGQLMAEEEGSSLA